MRGLPVAPFRLAALAAAALPAGAVLLGRLAPTAADSPPALTPGPASCLEVIQGNFTGDGRPRLFDLRTGRLGPMPLPEGERLLQAACSPWRDDRGGLQVLGGWSRAD